MKFKEFDTVRTLERFPEHGIDKGEIGSVVMVFANPHEAYEIEFVNDNGTTKAMFPILPGKLERI